MELKKEYFQTVPEFSGEKELLPRYLLTCEKLITKFYKKDDPTCFENTYLIDCLLAKIKGKASEIVFSHPTDTWEEVKRSLVNNFGNKRDSHTLKIELCSLKQFSNEDGFAFYQRVNKSLTNLISKVRTEITEATHLDYEIESIKKLGLRCLLIGFQEPLVSFMGTKNPLTMDDTSCRDFN